MGKGGLLEEEEGGQEGNRERGWDGRKGALNRVQGGRRSSEGKAKAQAKAMGRGRGRGPTGANTEAITLRTTNHKRVDHPNKVGGHYYSDGAPLHPSWEAARKRKAESAQVTGLFRGQKIRFD